ncbi:MAG: LacI family transcriptional regulator [Ignavibacteria bacterium]|nr:LacI family transcriptional regulator [Ignavibacteria bacterium]
MGTLKDVARLAGVSTATVSRVVNKSNNVDPETRTRVKKALKRLGYNPSRVARRLRVTRGKTNMLGLIIPDIQNPFFAELARGVEDVGYANNYAVLLCNSDESPQKEKFYLDVMRSEYVDGIIIPPLNETDQEVTTLVREGIPVVCVDRSVLTIPVDTVEVNNYRGAQLAIEFLIAKGHRRIGFVSGRPDISTSRDRLRGYVDTLKAHDIPADPELVRIGDYKQESGRLLTEQILDLSERPTALFVANNLMALGALAAIHNRGLRVPDDISLVGFDDLPWAESINPPLTVIRQPAYEVGRKAAEVLFERFANPDRKPSRISLDPVLVVRRSSG